MTGEPTVTGSGHAIRDAESKTSKAGNDYIKVTLRGDVEAKPKDDDGGRPSAWFIDVLVFGPDAEVAVAVRKGALCSFSGRLLNRRRYKGRNSDERENWTVQCNDFQSEGRAEAAEAHRPTIAEIREKLKAAEQEAQTARGSERTAMKRCMDLRAEVAAAKQATRTARASERTAKKRCAELRIEVDAAEQATRTAQASERTAKKRCAELRAEVDAAEDATRTARAAEQRWRKRADELEKSPDRGGRREIVAQVLGLPSPITRKAVKAAKRNVAKTLHPDVCKGPLATTMMQFLNSALDDLERSL